MHLQTLELVAAALLQHLSAPTNASPVSAPIATICIYPVNDFLFATGLDNINFFRLTRCCLPKLMHYRSSGHII